MKFDTENIGFNQKKSEERESLNLKEKTRFNSDKETRDFNYSKKEDINVHDPHHNYFNGIKNFEHEVGSDIDLDNYYHPGFKGFEDEEATSRNPLDDSEKDGEIGEVTNRYGLKDLEEWELENLMKDCELISFVDESKKGEATAMLMKKYEIEGIKEWQADDLVEEMASLYQPYLAIKKEKEFVFNDKGLERLSENDLEKLAGLYGEKSDLTFKIAEINGLIKNLKNESGSADPKMEEEAIISKLVYAYSTAKEENSEINKQADLKKKGPNITLKPEVVFKREQGRKRDELAEKLEEVEKQISIVKEPTREHAAQMKIINAEQRRESRAAKARAITNNDINLWKNVPEYSEKEIALRESVLAYVRKENGARKPVLEDGQELNKEQIEDVLREVARDKGWDKASFFAEVRKTKDKNGREQNIRQLAAVQNLNNGRRVKYTFASDNLPAGQYFYEADSKSFFISKNNPDSAIAPIKFFISTERPKKTLPEDVVKKMAEVAANKPAEPKVEIIKKKAPEVVEKRTPTIIKKEVSKDKPAPVIKKKINEPVI